MPPESTMPGRPATRPAITALWLMTLPWILAGCATNGASKTVIARAQDTQPQPDSAAAMALAVADMLEATQRLALAGAAEQAELLAGARAAAEHAPGGSVQLRYALMLAVPGPAGRDPERAQSLLRQLAAQPEGLTAVERALLRVQLSQLERELELRGDNQRLQGEVQRSEQQRQTVANQRLQTEIAENAKLRKQLEEAQAKLDAIAQIERSLNERQGATEGRKP